MEALVAGLVERVGIVQGRTLPDPAQTLEPLSRSQTVLSEYGLYETCNIAYTREALEAGGPELFSPELMATMRRLLGRSLAIQAFGEDVDLAWRVKRAGVASRFATHAVVHHHVFPPDRQGLLRRSALVAGFPPLVARNPELRHAFLWGRLFLSARQAKLMAAIVGASGARRWRPALVLTAPYIGALLSQRWRGPEKSPVLPAIAQDLVEGAALLYSSACTRTVVL